jgi:hypothetical protein
VSSLFSCALSISFPSCLLMCLASVPAMNAAAYGTVVDVDWPDLSASLACP